MQNILRALVVLVLIGGCASEEILVGSDAVPAARGKLTAEEVENNNTEITIEVEHLAPASRVSSGSVVYVVWIQPEGSSEFQNIGALNVDDDLKGEYKTKVPHREFRVLVTPEPSQTARRPSGVTIFDQSIGR